jgi:hypothetical protein
MADKRLLVSAVFRDRLDAEQALDYLRGLGYSDDDINVLMSDKMHAMFNARPHEGEHGPKRNVAEGMGVGGAIGTALGAAAAGLAAIGTTIALPGLGILVAGPIAAALAGAGAGAVTGGVIGAFVGLGINEQNAEVWQEALREGGIVIGVHPRSTEDVPRIQAKFREFHGESVVYA